MRTLAIISIIIVILLGGSIASYRYIQTTTQALGTHLSAVEQSASEQKWGTAQKELTSAQQSLDRTKAWWTVLLNHQDIDNIEIGMSRLHQYLRTQDIPLSLGELSTLRLQINNINENEKLNVKNVF